MANSLDEVLKEDLNTIVKTVAENINGVRTVVFNTVKGELVRRIFNNGIATDGSQIGTYELSTARFRVEAGRRTDKVDLSMSQTLQKSIIVGTEGNNIVLGMVDNKEPKLTVKDGRLKITGTSDFLTTDNAIQQEKNFGKEIFAPSEQEVEKSQELFVKEMDKLIKKALPNKTTRIKK